MRLRQQRPNAWIVHTAAWGVVFGLLTAASAGETEYVGPEPFLAKNQGAAYFVQARQFLADQPKSPRVGQVLVDMVVAATVLRDAEQTRQVRLKILLEHPQSLAVDFLIRSTSPQDLAELLSDRLHSADPPLTRATLQQVAAAIHLLQRDHGSGVLSEELWAAAALAQDSPAAAERLRRGIANPNSSSAKLLQIALEESLSARERFVRLRALHEFPLARSYQRLLFTEQLRDEDRDSVEVRTVVVENLLRLRHFAEALPELQTLAERTDEPRIHFFLGWAQASQGDKAAAVATFESLEQRSPDSPWAESAQQMIPVVAALDSSLAKHIGAMERILRRFASGKPDKIELALEDARPHDVRRRIRWQFNLPDDSFAMSAYRGEQLLLAYESSAEGSRFFVQGDSSIKASTSRGVCPLFTFQHSLIAAGGQSFHFHFNLVPQGGFALANSFRNLFTLPNIMTTQARVETLRHLVRSGAFPAPVVDASEDPVLRWHSLNLDAPTPHCLELATTSEDRLLEAAAGGWRVRDVQYGPRETTHFEPIVWPDAPVQEVKELQAAELMRLFAALVSLVQP
ncbi:MAG: tetratricopeptide repeat protein [Pirellulales bacterium]